MDNADKVFAALKAGDKIQHGFNGHFGKAYEVCEITDARRNVWGRDFRTVSTNVGYTQVITAENYGVTWKIADI